MLRVVMLVFVGLLLTATGCETGSTHENKADGGLAGQNVGESGTKAGPVPGSATGTDSTAYESKEPPAEQKPAPASTISSPSSTTPSRSDVSASGTAKSDAAKSDAAKSATPKK